MPIRALICLILYTLICGATLPLPIAASDTAPETAATLEVTGRAAVVVKPDTVLVSFSVEANARQASEAVATNARQTETLIAALRKIMGAEDKLKTASFNLQPVYDKDDRLRPSGYRVGNRVSLQTRQIAKIGDFIDAAAASGAGRINSLQFQTSQEASHRSDAAVLAVIQARTHAQKLAQAAGVAIGRVLRVRYAPQGRPGVFYENASLSMARTPIEVGDLTIESEVIMTFEIE